MAVNNDSFFRYNEDRALSGYRSAWLYKESTTNKYCLVGATESVPYVFSDKDNFEFDILQSPTKGQVAGKMSLESKDIEVLHHRDNAYRFNELKKLGTLDFMVINSEFVGYKFTGTLDYRPNDAEADINRATVTITPMSADVTPIFDARNDIAETLFFKNAIPATVAARTAVDFSVDAPSTVTATLTVKKIAAETNAESDATVGTEDGKDYSISSNNVTFKTTGLFKITASASNYAPWTTTVYVEAAPASTT